jgi:hypothetical protein
MNEFDERTARQKEKNINKWGIQPLPTLLIACGEEFGELCKAFLENNHIGTHNIKDEIIHLSSLLKCMYEHY